MRYAGAIYNDISNAGTGVAVTVYAQGCPHQCVGCHNPETWDYNGGKEFNSDTLQEILDAIGAYGVKRNLCIMGGEPMCQENLFFTFFLVKQVREKYPDIKIYLWTGYTLEELESTNLPKVKGILEEVNVLIDGKFELDKRDVTLPLRGSSNQRVIELR